MSDNPEYKYDGDEQNDIYEAVQETAPPRRSLFQNPKLILFIALIIVLYVAGFIASNYKGSTTSEPAQEVSSPITEKTTPPPAPEPTKVESKPVDLGGNPDFIVYQKKIQDELDELKGANNTMVDRLKNILTEITDLQKTIKTTSSDQEKQIDQRLGTLRNEVYDLRARLTVVEDRTKPKPAAVNTALKTYYLRGIIEGRAWISTKKGNSLTVRVGDELPDYGKITGIYPNQGFIMTSSKRMIIFSQNDR
tara:strand:- start:2360 stop:3109 length:750 start_codon:yes stop_codon:yes gene_type:complete